MSYPNGPRQGTCRSPGTTADWFTVCASIMALAHSVELFPAIPTAFREVRRRNANRSFLSLRTVSLTGLALPALRSGSALLWF